MAEPHHLEIYLNNHLAGSEVAIELLGHLERAYSGTPPSRFAVELRAEIEADQGELKDLMARRRIAPSRPRQAAAWLAEKFSELKLRFDDPSRGELRLLEIFEALSLGIEGKRLLWLALARAVEVSPELAGTDYGRLVQRAEDQRRRVELMRLEAAGSALAPPPPADR